MGISSFAQTSWNDLAIENQSYTIPAGTKEEFQNVYLNTNKSILTVNGTLIVHGNLDMVGNQSQFIMGPDAVVIIYGDFLSSNSVSITAKSYLIIYGSFINNTPSNKAELDIEGGNIYIFGTVDNWGENFTTCDAYEGNTEELNTETCDYGTKDDFDDNADDFPDDVKELLPCVANYAWTGAVDSNWNNTANWSCDQVPDLSTSVLIPSGLNNYPTVNSGANALAKDLTIDAGAELIITNNWIRIAGTLANSGSLNVENGSVSFEGTSAQTIPAGAFTGNRVLKLRINNVAGVSSQATIEIINSLEVTTGIFATGNDLTLLSTASGTAYIEGSGAGEITGLVKMQRFLNNGFGYKYFSSPFSNSTVADFSGFMDLTEATTGFPHFYEYLENRKDSDGNDLTGWQAYTAPANSLDIARGYALNISGSNSPVTIEIAGEVNNGPVSISLENNGGLFTKGFNLVGNPYPSPIDWDLMTPGLSGIDNAVYFFKAGSENRYTGTYSSFVNGVSTGVNNTIIPSMQGFFVRVSDPGTATLDFSNAVRTGNLVSQAFYKTKRNKILPQIKLTAGFAGETNSDATVIYFESGATPAFQKELDALKLLNTTAEVPSLYSISGEQEKLSINAISAAEFQEIPLGINSEKGGQMIIELKNVQNVFPSTFIYLKDQKNKLIHNLWEVPAYSFTSQKGENNNRFSLILSSENLSEDLLKSSFALFSAHNFEGDILVRLQLSENVLGTVILSNLSGQVLQKRKGKGKEELRFSGISAPGVYLVTLELGNEIQTKKILIKK
ncbi:T9SS type A sorting domain-containing protein [Salinimicrobium oceani]|uniref:T9SS type A sorting domain-containing protein n=1 Tax=Salinimicrobium oceani TaxID=2722702 RepID=A0ABX1D356_9FLAO|nr:T9SS type A sorting domain-containing protein [Salinimicrobium oceani]NJW53341.1 T9SS type A sorting domain-containing protein [Salinimicrobium oceani]